MAWRDKRGLSEHVPRGVRDNRLAGDTVALKLPPGPEPLPALPLVQAPADPAQPAPSPDRWRRTDVVEESVGVMAPRIEAADAVAPVTRLPQTNGGAVRLAGDEQQAAQAFKDAIQPVWDAFTRSIRSTAADFNRSAGHDVVAVPDDAGDLVQMRTAHAEWSETFDIRLDRTARIIVGRRREAGPGVGRALSEVPVPTLTLQVTDAPMRFGGRNVTAADAGSILVRRIVADRTRHLPEL